jgi:DNA-binding LacI/PurR family transcriptional regulator
MAKNLLPRAQITSTDVARFAGVSQATVSRAFKPTSSIADATRSKILDAARRLNYVPNSFARGLITGQSNIVAMLLGDLHNPFYTVAVDEFSRRLQAMGKHLLLFSVPENKSIDDAVLQMLEYQVDGIVITAATMSMQTTDLCIERKIPIILFNRYVPGFSTHSVCCDNLAGGRLAAETFSRAGARGYGVIYGDSSSTTNADRLQGFLSQLSDIGIHNVSKSSGHYTYEGGYDAAKKLLTKAKPPDALFCVNDIMALGAIDAARELGRRIPEELMIIGFDDIHEASRASYQLTTIRQPIRQMVDQAITILTTPPANMASCVLPGRLIIRATTRNA